MISYTTLIRVFGRIGLLSFGGPAAQIALMHKELVDQRTWLSEDQFLRALSFCMLLPGPEAMQLATYAGWRQRGIIGGLIGGGLFVLPGAIVIGILALLYSTFGSLPVVQAVFVGIKATVVVIVIEAMIKLSRRALLSRQSRALAIGAFIALFFFAVPFPIVIAVAAIIGALTAAPQAAETAVQPFAWQRSLMILILGGLIWAAPFAFLTNAPEILWDIGAYFAWLAVVTFGGAYAVLAYMTQSVVGDFGWLTTTQMIDALGLAETTPGPLILVTQFVGMTAADAAGGKGLSLIAGALTLWVTFVPCFLWIFAGAPLIDWLQGQPRLRAALAAITASVVGVIANLSLWFALHVLFADVSAISLGPLQSVMPVITTWQPTALILTLLAAVLLLARMMNLIWVITIIGALGGIISLI